MSGGTLPRCGTCGSTLNTSGTCSLCDRPRRIARLAARLLDVVELLAARAGVPVHLVYAPPPPAQTPTPNGGDPR